MVKGNQERQYWIDLVWWPAGPDSAKLQRVSVQALSYHEASRKAREAVLREHDDAGQV